jgi:hypothetical protein
MTERVRENAQGRRACWSARRDGSGGADADHAADPISARFVPLPERPEAPAARYHRSPRAIATASATSPSQGRP